MAETGPALASQAELASSGRALVEHDVFEAAVRKTRMAIADPNLPDHPLIYINGVFTELTGYQADAVIGRNSRFLQGSGTDPEAVRRIWEAVAEQRPIVEELYNHRHDGSDFWNSLFITPIFGDDGKLEYFFASQTDVSPHREAFRRQARRADNISALVSGVAHQFNNLMTVVLGSVEHATTLTDSEDLSRQLRRVASGAKRAGEIVEELLVLVRRDPAGDTRVGLDEAMREFANGLASALPPGVQLETEIAAGPMAVLLSRDQLLRALHALTRNALEAMPDGGVVHLTARGIGASPVDGPATVELQVRDTGPGMSSEVRERATDVFFTTRAGNSGLGFFLVLDFVEKSGGWLAIDSESGKSTAVRMVFPGLPPA